ncbi:MFS transporter [Vibrio crassostreae]|nr:MFS transporter [Vibrio crassostreae]CAK3041201.1 MFS transporter [Vibrio crassostreae]CAK3041527.1 MFS transporter [Vibrio crassostreae]CAK3043782.1 MFS transporter [Vibrio crassostreae]CAK3043883.1 MFS transporter [Vibrio crassostreae]
MQVPTINRYIIGAALFIGYTLFALSWKAGDLFISNIGYDANDLSTLIAALNIVKVVANFLIGVITANFIAEKTFLNNSNMFVAGCFSVAASMLLMPYCENFYLLSMIRALLGLGGALILFSMNPLVASIFPEKELPIVNGLNSAAFNIGIAIMLTGAALMKSAPELVMLVTAIVAVTAGFAFLFANRNAINQVKMDLDYSKGGIHNEESTNEKFGIIDALKDRFNWLFSITFTGIMAFYYVAFTFLDVDTVMFLIYAGIIGNFAGIAGAKTLKHTTVIRLCASLSLILAVAFLFTLEQSVSKFIAFALGFTIFFSLPSYVTLGFGQKNATPKRIGLTFMMLWVVSDLLATFILKFYAFLASNPGSESMATLFILLVTSVFTIGCFFIKDVKQDAESVLSQGADTPVVA